MTSQPGDVIEELSQPLGGVSPDIYQKAYFKNQLQKMPKHWWEWAVKNNVPNNDTKSEILIRPDGTFVSTFRDRGPKQKPFELIEHGLWKLEDGISIGALKVDYQG